MQARFAQKLNESRLRGAPTEIPGKPAPAFPRTPDLIRGGIHTARDYRHSRESGNPYCTGLRQTGFRVFARNDGALDLRKRNSHQLSVSPHIMKPGSNPGTLQISGVTPWPSLLRPVPVCPPYRSHLPLKENNPRRCERLADDTPAGRWRLE